MGIPNLEKTSAHLKETSVFMWCDSINLRTGTPCRGRPNSGSTKCSRHLQVGGIGVQEYKELQTSKQYAILQQLQERETERQVTLNKALVIFQSARNAREQRRQEQEAKIQELRDLVKLWEKETQNITASLATSFGTPRDPPGGPSLDPVSFAPFINTAVLHPASLYPTL